MDYILLVSQQHCEVGLADTSLLKNEKKTLIGKVTSPRVTQPEHSLAQKALSTGVMS